jgi:hypothetical protein
MGAWGYGKLYALPLHEMQTDQTLAMRRVSPRWRRRHKPRRRPLERARKRYTASTTACTATVLPPPDVVRKHLDSGVLVKLIAQKEATLLAMPTKERELEFHRQDPCYAYVLLGACAMTLGCRLPESYTAMLKKVYTEGGLMPDALKQME